MDFKGKVVLISGATGGMGGEIARQLSKEGCNLALFARREERLKKLSEEISIDKTECIYKKCDIKNKKDVEEAVKFTHKKFGRIDVALLTAGVLTPNPIETLDSTIIKDSMEINFLGNVYFIESLFPIMKHQKSGIIAAVSTLPDRRGVAGWGAYGASKAALSWFMESLRAEAKKKYNINIVTIKPGSVETPMLENYYRPGSISAEKAAEIIIKGIKRGKKIIQFPVLTTMLVRIQNMLPVFVHDRIPIDVQKGDGYPVVEENRDEIFKK
ncbi:MAG: SDR family NAD(P)-dependent oxidoreductase [Candidatus Thermoplasmatota archaeon]|jgi:short-subunit dehydrogenase|nr:SDR family NAD(P)-dependent oxidoreductase [Candidatus Thermoplasmatota archaeon]